MTAFVFPTLQPPPRGSRKCANDCNGVGNCHAGFGYCQCPAGEFILYVVSRGWSL